MKLPRHLLGGLLGPICACLIFCVYYYLVHIINFVHIISIVLAAEVK